MINSNIQPKTLALALHKFSGTSIV